MNYQDKKTGEQASGQGADAVRLSGMNQRQKTLEAYL